jgi:hypothetical protein
MRLNGGGGVRVRQDSKLAREKEIPGIAIGHHLGLPGPGYIWDIFNKYNLHNTLLFLMTLIL